MKLDKQKVANAFSRAANSYDDVAIVQQQVLQEHLDRLSVTSINPEKILEIGSGTGEGNQQLAKLFKKSHLVAMDIAQGMLQENKRRLPRFRNRISLTCGDVDCLPFENNCFDLVFSNLALQWSNDLDVALKEIKRVMKTGGLLSFTTVGPDTLKELSYCWDKINAGTHTHEFVDMHLIGDALIKHGFGAPVLDIDRYTLTYPSVKNILQDLKSLGATYASTDRTKGLTTKETLQKLQATYENLRVDNVLPLTYEIIYAHAWVPAETMRPQDGSTVAMFPVSEIKRHK